MLPALTAAVQRRLFHVFTPIGGTRAAPLSSAPQPAGKKRRRRRRSGGILGFIILLVL
jgi:hypothetical protein